jgi:hypothetical protein
MKDITNLRVLALESSNGKTIRVYGEGTLLGSKTPDAEPFKSLNLKNPCILLDSGKYVWGYQCWWGELEKMKDTYKDYKVEKVEVLNEVFPVKEGEEVV